MRLLENLYGLSWELFQAAQGQVGEEGSANSSVIILKRMMNHIRTHYAEKLKVEDIAAAGGICRTKCWQIFRKYLGQTPNDYLDAFRLEKGMQLLKDTRLSISEIADRCGFSSASYFTKLFTCQKGCTPSVYRKI